MIRHLLRQLLTYAPNYFAKANQCSAIRSPKPLISYGYAFPKQHSRLRQGPFVHLMVTQLIFPKHDPVVIFLFKKC